VCVLIEHEGKRPRVAESACTVFGLRRDELTMEEVARRYAERFGRHRDDRLLD
jgi:hypothetical protein